MIQPSKEEEWEYVSQNLETRFEAKKVDEYYPAGIYPAGDDVRRQFCQQYFCNHRCVGWIF